ncbi:hypothetical protein AAVH_15622 [Aphelenchoides avenae]|nr:hypothetical protein AAVH_15622 [Aphelenchus avenae]
MLAEGIAKGLWTRVQTDRLRIRVGRLHHLYRVALSHLWERFGNVPIVVKRNLGPWEDVYIGPDALRQWRRNRLSRLTWIRGADEWTARDSEIEAFLRGFFITNMSMPWDSVHSARPNSACVPEYHESTIHTYSASAAVSQVFRQDNNTSTAARSSDSASAGIPEADGGATSSSDPHLNPMSIYAPIRIGHTIEMKMRERYGTSKRVLYPPLQAARRDVQTYLEKVRNIHIQLGANPTDELMAELELTLTELVLRETLVYQLSMALGLANKFRNACNVLPSIGEDDEGPQLPAYSRERGLTTGRDVGISERVRQRRKETLPDEPYQVVSLKPLVETITDDQLANELKLRALPGVVFWKVSDRTDYTTKYKYAWVQLQSKADAIAFRAAYDNTDHPGITPAKENGRGHWELRVQYSSYKDLHPDMKQNKNF